MGSDDIARHQLRLYIAGTAPFSAAAIAALTTMWRTGVLGCLDIEIIDLEKDPGLAREDNVIAIPTLIRRFPCPARRVVGNLSDLSRALAALNITDSAPTLPCRNTDLDHTGACGDSHASNRDANGLVR